MKKKGKEVSKEEEGEEKKRSIWDVLNNLSFDKKEENRSKDLELFSTFMITRALGKYPDCLFYANEINQLSASIEPRMAYDFYFNALPPRKRFAKWFKSSKNEELIEIIKSYFSVSQKVALGYLQLLSEEQKKQFTFIKGGVR